MAVIKKFPVWVVVVFLLWSLLSLTENAKGQFTQRTNIVIIVDVAHAHQTRVATRVQKLLDGISLRKHRIAFYSTSGVKQMLVDYQSRQCSVNKLKHFRSRNHQLSTVLRFASKELHHKFRKDKNIFVVMTDRKRLSAHTRYVFKNIQFTTNNMENYIIRVKHGKHEMEMFSVTKFDTSVLVTGLEDFDVVLQELSFYKASLKSCMIQREGSIVSDECNRYCECIDGRLVNCFRLRTQFSKLPLNERVTYINAYKTLASDQRFAHAFYKHIRIHPTVNFTVLHSKSQLLPFHRKYTLVFENFLRLVDCRLTVPYWNFALHAKHLFKRVPGYHAWDAYGGFGSTRTSINNGFCIKTGPFRYPHWKLPTSFVRSIDEMDRFDSVCSGAYEDDDRKLMECKKVLKKTFNPRCMTRLLTGSFKIPTYKHVHNILHSSRTTFARFERFLRNRCHASIHDNMGGDFGYGFSSILPEFFPLHSMLDAMWDYWQNKGSGTRYKGHWQNNHKFRIIGFRTPRYWYLDNDNLEMCGVRIVYTDIFPKKQQQQTDLEVKRTADSSTDVFVDETDSVEDEENFAYYNFKDNILF